MILAIKRVVPLLIPLLWANLHVAYAGSLHVCVDHVDPDDWQAEWNGGAIKVPAGAVFDFGGHLFGSDLQDPHDFAHWDDGKNLWSGISAQEAARRDTLTAQDVSPSTPFAKEAVITTSELTLTEQHPCGNVNAATVLSGSWNWTAYPVFGESTIYFEVYGVIQGGQLNTSFDGGTPFDAAGQRTELHAIVNGTLTDKITLQDNQQ